MIFETYTLDRFEDALAEFKRDYPAFDVEALDALRAEEYSRLDVQGHVYLDYTPVFSRWICVSIW